MKKKRSVVHFIGGNSEEFLKQQLEVYDKAIYEYTSYTASVIVEDRKFVFHPTSKIKKPFHVFEKVKREIKKSGVEVPNIDKSKINWHNFSKRKFPKEFYSVDLSSAYASVLLKYKAITEETYHEILNKIPKEDRLKAIGMLGTLKSRLTYERGKEPILEKVESEFANWFFFCCYVTGEIMELTKEHCIDDYLFYWVDGIAVSQNPQKALDFMAKLGYKSKVDIITECEAEDGVIFYKKNGKEKVLHIPKSRKIQNNEVIKFLVKSGEQDSQEALQGNDNIKC